MCGLKILYYVVHVWTLKGDKRFDVYTAFDDDELSKIISLYSCEDDYKLEVIAKLCPSQLKALIKKEQLEFKFV